MFLRNGIGERGALTGARGTARGEEPSAERGGFVSQRWRRVKSVSTRRPPRCCRAITHSTMSGYIAGGHGLASRKCDQKQPGNPASSELGESCDCARTGSETRAARVTRAECRHGGKSTTCPTSKPRRTVSIPAQEFPPRWLSRRAEIAEPRRETRAEYSCPKSSCLTPRGSRRSPAHREFAAEGRIALDHPRGFCDKSAPLASPFANSAHPVSIHPTGRRSGQEPALCPGRHALRPC